MSGRSGKVLPCKLIVVIFFVEYHTYFINHPTDETVSVKIRHITSELVKVLVQLSKINGSCVSFTYFAICCFINVWNFDTAMKVRVIAEDFRIVLRLVVGT